ncbi:hypothetical protein [Nostoc sp. WHI]|uniref:hypothetical protein n=1 Tax=Nostoc sp. WHI TaxID=2650611 RepID=UPI0018C55C02|nr:hypothetical protein [Nostoc sp. WHI]
MIPVISLCDTWGCGRWDECTTVTYICSPNRNSSVSALKAAASSRLAIATGKIRVTDHQ